MRTRKSQGVSVLAVVFGGGGTDGIVDGRVTDPPDVLQEGGDFLRHTEEVERLVDEVRPQIEYQAHAWCGRRLPGLPDALAEPVEATAV